MVETNNPVIEELRRGVQTNRAYMDGTTYYLFRDELVKTKQKHITLPRDLLVNNVSGVEVS